MKPDEIKLGSRVRITPQFKPDGGLTGAVRALNVVADNDKDRRRHALIEVPGVEPLLAVAYRDLQRA